MTPEPPAPEATTKAGAEPDPKAGNGPVQVERGVEQLRPRCPWCGSFAGACTRSMKSGSKMRVRTYPCSNCRASCRSVETRLGPAYWRAADTWTRPASNNPVN